MQSIWYVIHWGRCSWLIIKECVSLVWRMHNQNIVNCSFLDILNTVLQSSKVDLVKKSLLWMLSFQHFCTNKSIKFMFQFSMWNQFSIWNRILYLYKLIFINSLWNWIFLCDTKTATRWQPQFSLFSPPSMNCFESLIDSRQEIETLKIFGHVFQGLLM